MPFTVTRQSEGRRRGRFRAKRLRGTGIEIFAVSGLGTISGTQVLSDAVSDDHFGVWHVGDTGTHIAHLTTDGVADPVAP